MPLRFDPWHLMIRVVRGDPPERSVVAAVCEEVHDNEDGAHAALADWRINESRDDLLWVAWNLGSGYQFRGSSVRAIDKYGQSGVANSIAAMLAPALLVGIRLCVAAMLGEFGEDDVSYMRPS